MAPQKSKFTRNSRTLVINQRINKALLSNKHCQKLKKGIVYIVEFDFHKKEV